MFRSFKALRKSKRSQQRLEKTFQIFQNTIKQDKDDPFTGKIKRSYVSFMNLEVKKQKSLVIFKDKQSHVISPGLLWRLKCIKLGVANLFRGFKAKRKIFLMLFQGKRINKRTKKDCKLNGNCNCI